MQAADTKITQILKKSEQYIPAEFMRRYGKEVHLAWDTEAQEFVASGAREMRIRPKMAPMIGIRLSVGGFVDAAEGYRWAVVAVADALDEIDRDLRFVSQCELDAKLNPTPSPAASEGEKASPSGTDSPGEDASE